MTAENAIDKIENHICQFCTIDDDCDDCEFGLAIEALEEKEKPRFGKNGKYHCPKCNNSLTTFQHYCDNCGQHLDGCGRMNYSEAIVLLKRIRLFDVKGWDSAFPMAIHALEKQIPKPPIPDENATDRFGKPVPRCQVCGYALDLQIEQYCPCCGQRLTEYEVEE